MMSIKVCVSNISKCLNYFGPNTTTAAILSVCRSNKTIPAVTKRVINQPMQLAAMRAGILEEPKILAKLSTALDGMQITKRQQTCAMALPNGLEISGRVDGLHENFEGQQFIIEVKNRFQKLFDTIPEYEMIQLQLYMKMMNVNDAIWAQQFRDELDYRFVARDEEFIQRVMKRLDVLAMIVKLGEDEDDVIELIDANLQFLA